MCQGAHSFDVEMNELSEAHYKDQIGKEMGRDFRTAAAAHSPSAVAVYLVGGAIPLV